MTTEGTAEPAQLAPSEDESGGDFFEPWKAEHCAEHPGSWRRDCVACLSWQLAQAVNVAGTAITSYVAWVAAVLTTQQTARNEAGDRMRAALETDEPAVVRAAVRDYLALIDDQAAERLAAFEALRTGHTIGFDAAIIMEYRLPEADRRRWLEDCASMVDVGTAG